MAKRIYPHVAIQKNAIPRAAAVVEESTAPIMFVPFCSERGPSNEFRKIYTLGEFGNTYGFNTFDNSDTEHELLNISNWLSAGGAILALRLTDDTYKKATTKEVTFSFGFEEGNGESKTTKTETFKVKFSAKYPGISYKNLAIAITKGSTKLKFEVKEGTGAAATILESFYVPLTSKSMLEKIKYSSQYFEGEKVVTDSTEKSTEDFLNSFATKSPNSISITSPNGGVDGNLVVAKISEDKTVITFKLSYYGDEGATSETGRDGLVKKFLSVLDNSSVTEEEAGTKNSSTTEKELTEAEAKTYTNLISVFKNKLECPCDVIMDASYPQDIKKLLLLLAPLRDDIHFYIDIHTLGLESNQSTNEESEDFLLTLANLKDEDGEKYNCANISYFSQYLIENNIYTNNDIKVGPSYYLSTLVAENEIKYGIQKPVAGLTRGVISGFSFLSSNPDPDTKDKFYTYKNNYIERDSRGARFMCQLTKDTDNTALSFINNSRTTNRIARDIEAIGRKYLFEFNDTTTLNTMKSEMNKYLSSWVQNRTLDYFYLEVNQRDDSDTIIDVPLSIRFLGTIEIISVSITIE